MCVCMCVCLLRSEEGVGFLGGGYKLPDWGLGTKLQSSARAASTLSYEMSPQNIVHLHLIKL